MPGQPGEIDAARFQLYEEQHVIGREAAPSKYLHGEKVSGGQNVHMSGNEILPGCVLATLWRRWDPVPPKDVTHRLIGDGMAEIGQRSDDPIVSPTGVLSGEPDNERFDCRRDWWVAGSPAAFGAVEFTSNEAPVPSKGLYRV